MPLSSASRAAQRAAVALAREPSRPAVMWVVAMTVISSAEVR